MTSTTTKSAPPNPLIVVIGPTGTGKSKLAVSLAQRYNGEIVNADATQLYCGLPIVTNKIPEEARCGIVHHLLDVISLHEKPWTVQRFVKETNGIIEGIRSRGNVPIVVGGTMYYVLGLLLGRSTLIKQASDSKDENRSNPDKVRGEPDLTILERETPTIYAKLQEVDPIMAKRWHPQDRRHIIRSLEIYLTTGRRASDTYREQKAVQDDIVVHNNHGELPRNHEPLVFWLDAEDTILKARLNDRVDTMVTSGLVEEVQSMRKYEYGYGIPGSLDKSAGVWQAIGFKELEPWLSAVEDENDDAEKLEHMKFEGVEMIKGATRRYAKRQNRYIRIKFANELQSAGILDKLFLLDTSQLQNWEQEVEAVARRIVDAFLAGRPLPDASTLSKLSEKIFTEIQRQAEVEKEARTCEICNKTLMTQKEWEKHIHSKGHKKTVQHSKRNSRFNRSDGQSDIESS